MHQDILERLGRERFERLRREADQHRLVRAARASEHGHQNSPGRVRIVLGDRLVRLGIRLRGSEHAAPMPARFRGEYRPIRKNNGASTGKASSVPGR